MTGLGWLAVIVGALQVSLAVWVFFKKGRAG